jgi:hypothetical protein
MITEYEDMRGDGLQKAKLDYQELKRKQYLRENKNKVEVVKSFKEIN